MTSSKREPLTDLMDISIHTDETDDDGHSFVVVRCGVAEVTEGEAAITCTNAEFESAQYFFAGLFSRLAMCLLNDVEAAAQLHRCRRITLDAYLGSSTREPQMEDLHDPNVRVLVDYGRSCHVSVSGAKLTDHGWGPDLYLCVPKGQRVAWRKRVEDELNALLASIPT
jgi:hypothetical protein